MAAVALPAAPLAARLANAFPGAAAASPAQRDAAVIPPPPARAAVAVPPPIETTAAPVAVSPEEVHRPGVPQPPPPPPPPQPADDALDGDDPNAPFAIQTVPNPTSTLTDNTIVVTPTVATAAATAPPQTAPPSQPGQQGDDAEAQGGGATPQFTAGDCRLMGPFAIFVQLGLGALALMSLVYKRWRERPQRPVKIWFFDASKQVFGSVLVHVANVFMSLLTSGRFSVMSVPGVARRETAAGAVVRALTGRAEDDYMPNPCSFYLLNLAIDTTLGIPILIFLLRLATLLVSYTPLGQPPQSIQSGNYGHPPRVWWWLKQSVLYFCGLFGMKICVLVIFLTMPWIVRVGDWALGWTEGNEQLQIVFVMMLFPLIMNAMQYYIIDSFIKEQTPAAGVEEGDSSDDDDDGGGSSGSTCQNQNGQHTRYDRLSDSADDEDSDNEGAGRHRRHVHAHHKHHGAHRHRDNSHHPLDAASLLADDEDEDEELGEVGLVSKKTTADSAPAAASPHTAPTPTPAATATNHRRHHSRNLSRPEYDPELDGDSPTIIGSSSSQQSRQASVIGSLSKEMYSKE